MPVSSRIQMTDIAKRAGLSLSGVSRALRNDPRMRPATRKRVQQVAKELGYTLQRRQSLSAALWQFGFIYCDSQATEFDPGIFAPVLHLLMRDSARLNSRFEMLLLDDDISRESAKDALIDFVKRLQGVLLFGRVHAAIVQLLNRVGVPCVVIGETDASPAEAETTKMQRVTDDPMRTAFQATRYLLDRGRRRIAFIGGVREPDFFYDQWYRGYLLAHAQADLPIEPARVMFQELQNPLGDRVARLLDPAVRPDAIVFPDLTIAQHALQWMREKGLDLAVEDQVLGGMSHMQVSSVLDGIPRLLTDLAALTKEAILRLQFICKQGADTSALIVLPALKRNFPGSDRV